MNKYIKPQALEKGDTIAIVSPSSSIAKFPLRLNRSLEFLQSLGYRVRVMPNALLTDGFSAGTPEARASDINDAFRDNEIRAILCSTGGLTANAVLPHLDFQLMRKHPKIFCGYSDITTLLLAIASRSGLVTFHGPTLLPSFGEYEGAFGGTADHFVRVLSSRDAVGLVPSSTFCAAENLFWDKDDVRELKVKEVSVPFVCGVRKNAQGVLFGGNLQTVSMLARSEFVPDFSDTILVLEEEGLSTAWYERYLLSLEQAGIFSVIRGLIIGRPSNSFREDAPEKRTLMSIFDSIGKKYDIPVLMDIDCGHSKPLVTLPFGCKGMIDVEKSALELIEGAVV